MPPDPKAAAGSAGSGIKGGLTRKVGPLPVWGWAAIVGGGFVAYTFLRGGSGDPTTEAGIPVDMGSGGGGGGSSGGSGVDTSALDAAIARLADRIDAIPTPGGTGGGGTGGGGYSDGGGGAGSGTSGPLGGVDITSTAEWAAYNARRLDLISQFGPDAPYSEINRILVSEYGGYIYPGQGPEENLTVGQYKELVLGQYPGQNPNLLTDPTATYSKSAWYQYMLTTGRDAWVNGSGVLDPAEWDRNVEIARLRAQEEASGLAQGTLGNPSTSGSPPAMTNLPIPTGPTVPAPSVSQPAPVASAPRVTTADALNAIRSRYPGLNWEGVKAQYDRNVAKGLTNAQMVQ